MGKSDIYTENLFHKYLNDYDSKSKFDGIIPEKLEEMIESGFIEFVPGSSQKQNGRWTSTRSKVYRHLELDVYIVYIETDCRNGGSYSSYSYNYVVDLAVSKTRMDAEDVLKEAVRVLSQEFVRLGEESNI